MLVSLTFKLIDFLFEENSKWQIALGTVLGMWLGFLPVLTLQWWVCAAALLFFRLSLISGLLSMFVFWGLGSFFVPMWDRVGQYLLTQILWLQPILSWMHHAPVIPYTFFNHTVILGATLSALFLSMPLFWLALAFVSYFREPVYDAWKRTKLSRQYSYYRHYV